MSHKVYKLYTANFTDAWYALSQKERDDLFDKVVKARKEAGGELIVNCFALWSSEEWPLFGLEVFPNIESEQTFAAAIWKLELGKYMKSKTIIGTDLQELYQRD